MRLLGIDLGKTFIVVFDYTYGAPRINFRAEASIAIGWLLSIRRRSRTRRRFERREIRRDGFVTPTVAQFGMTAKDGELRFRSPATSFRLRSFSTRFGSALFVAADR